MPFISAKNPSYLVKHRRKWQVKLTIPNDVRWAFDNKTTYKRSTGCDIEDVNQAIIERDLIVAKFKADVKLHRSSKPSSKKSENKVGAEFNQVCLPKDYQETEMVNHSKPMVQGSEVEGWIKERLLNKSKNMQVLRYDFWNFKKKN